MGSSKVKSRSNKVSTEKKKKKKTGIHKEKKRFIHKCNAQVSPADFALSHHERTFCQWLLREEREIPRSDSKISSQDITRHVIQGHKISNKILMLTMKHKAQQQGLPVGGVPPPPSVFALDSDKCLKELNEKIDASSKVPRKLDNFLTMELNTRFDPSLQYMVIVLREYIWLEIVRKAPVPLVGCLTEEDVVARLFEEFGLLCFPRPEDVLRDVVQKCFVAFQMLEAEAVVLEQMCFN